MNLEESFQNRQKPVVLVRFDFDSGTVFAWTRPFSGEFEGNIYQPIASLSGPLAIRQSLDRPSFNASTQLTGNAKIIQDIALTEDFQLRDVTISLANRGPDNKLEASKVIFPGVIQDMPLVDRAGDPTVTVNLESVFAEIDRRRDLRYSSADQKRFNPDDTFFDSVGTVSILTPRFGD